MIKEKEMNKTIKCPYCKSENVARYAYGMPAFNEELEEKLANDEIVLGGCCIKPNSSAYKCNDCGKDFGNYNDLKG